MAAKKRRSYRRYARSAYRRVTKFTIPLAPIVGLIAAPSISNSIAHVASGNFAEVPRSLKGLIGVDGSGNFDSGLLISNITPIVIGLLIHKVLGGMLGLNRMLGRAGVPILRL